MDKKTGFLLLFLLITILGISFISANLCKGSNGYYQDCENYYKDTERYYINIDKYEEDRYSGRNYYKDYNRYDALYRPSVPEVEYKEKTEYTQTIESKYKDRYGYENIKTTVSEKIEIDSKLKGPFLYLIHPNHISKESNKEYSAKNWWDFLYEV